MVIRYEKERTDAHLDSASPRTNMFIPPNSEVSISMEIGNRGVLPSIPRNFAEKRKKQEGTEKKKDINLLKFPCPCASGNGHAAARREIAHRDAAAGGGIRSCRGGSKR